MQKSDQAERQASAARLAAKGSDPSSQNRESPPAAPPTKAPGWFSPSELLWLLSGAPWIWGLIRNDGSPARTIHCAFQRHTWRQHNVIGKILVCVCFIVGMPVVVAMIIRYSAMLGPSVRKRAGKGAFRQAGEQLTLWLTEGILPLSYYVFELYRDDARRNALEYLFRYETKRGVYAILRNSFSSDETTEALRNKAGFALRCKWNGVPAVPALFTVERGLLTRFDSDETGLPRCDLFLKPLSGSGGRGAAVWRYLGDGRYCNTAVGVVHESALIDHLTSLSRTEPYVGRLYVSNHTTLAQLSPGALSSIRVVTCLDENGHPEVTDGVMRMARTPGSVVDNFHAGGIAARVDLRTGVLGPATDLGLSRHTQWWEAHPLTGAAIRGRQIPMWNEVLDLALRAHTLFADQVVVGWDVAITGEGPQLIEGNKSPDLDILQRTSGGPIGNSRFGVLLAYHLRRALLEHQYSSAAVRPAESIP